MRTENKLCIAFFVLLASGCSVLKTGVHPVKMKVEVCKHYNDADATILIVTDKYIPHDQKQFQNDNKRYGAIWAEFLAFKYNIPIHVFEDDSKNLTFKEFINTGRGGASVYYPSCKTMYDKNFLDRKIREIASVSSTRPTTISYGCGKTEYADSLPKYILGGRNSEYTAFNSGDTCITWYGKNTGYSGKLNFEDTRNIISRPCSGRFFLDIRNTSEINPASEFVKKQVQLTTSSNGFYVNFLHWHEHFMEKNKKVDAVSIMDELFQSAAAGIGSYRIAKVDYNQAIEYLHAKEAIDTVYITKDRKLTNLVIKSSKKRPVDYSVIQTPLTIRFEKRRAGQIKYQRILAHDNILKVYQDNKFVYLNIKPDFTNQEQVISINYGTRQKIPLLWQVPVMIYNQTSQTVDVTPPSKFVLFMKKKGADPFKVEVIDRTFDLLNQYNLVTLLDEYDYFLGAISEEGESSLLEIK